MRHFRRAYAAFHKPVDDRIFDVEAVTCANAPQVHRLFYVAEKYFLGEHRVVPRLRVDIEAEALKPVLSELHVIAAQFVVLLESAPERACVEYVADVRLYARVAPALAVVVLPGDHNDTIVGLQRGALT